MYVHVLYHIFPNDTKCFVIVRGGEYLQNRRPLQPCREPTCPRYSEPGTNTCTTHKSQHRPKRGEAALLHRLYCTRAWTDGRAAFLAIHPLCVECEKEGVLFAATIVDHIEPHRGDLKLFYDQTNWQPLCKPHHDIKTAAEDGGFGNQRRSRRQAGQISGTLND